MQFCRDVYRFLMNRRDGELEEDQRGEVAKGAITELTEVKGKKDVHVFRELVWLSCWTIQPVPTRGCIPSSYTR